MADWQRRVLHSHQDSTLIQVQDAVLLFKDLKHTTFFRNDMRGKQVLPSNTTQSCRQFKVETSHLSFRCSCDFRRQKELGDGMLESLRLEPQFHMKNDLQMLFNLKTGVEDWGL